MLHWILLGLTCWGRGRHSIYNVMYYKNLFRKQHCYYVVVDSFNQMSYTNLCEVKRNSISGCPTYTHVLQYTDSESMQVISLSNFNYRDDHILLILEDTDPEFDRYQYHDNGTGCFYLESTSLVFMFLTRTTLIVISLQSDSITEGSVLVFPSLGVCNTSCDFIWNSEVLSGNCSTYKMLTALVQERQQLCYNENISIDVSVENEMVTINVDNSELRTESYNMEFIDCRGKSH